MFFLVEPINNNLKHDEDERPSRRDFKHQRSKTICFKKKKICADLVCWHTAQGKLWQEDLEFKDSLSYKLSFKGTCNIRRPYLKKKEKNPGNNI